MKAPAFSRIVRILIVLLGGTLGIALAHPVMSVMESFDALSPSNAAWGLIRVILYVAGGAVGVLVSFIISAPAARALQRQARRAEAWLGATEPGDFLFGSIGVALGLAIAFLITRLFSGLLLWISIPLSAAVYLVLGYVGGYFGAKRWRDLPERLLPIKPQGEKPDDGGPSGRGGAKVLDTSVIIDGRVLDIARAGFLEGRLLIPPFVLSELRHIADSNDDLRRRRGRRGLDVLRELQQEERADVELLGGEDGQEALEADERLLKLAARLSAAVLTTDYNLNKVAQVSGVPVLNINELANAVKPVLLPGETLTIRIVKEGKEHGQGVAYLDDGTMVVVENGRGAIGRETQVAVTSTLQTAAGRMVFARLPEA